MMSDEIIKSMEEIPLIASKTVTKVQNLPNIGCWNDNTAILRDYAKVYFSKKTFLLRMNHTLPTRKRVIILTPDDFLLVYETNCTGYVFPICDALKLKTSTTGIPYDCYEKTCTVSLKYPFGSVNLSLVNHQISVWRRTLSSIFEGENLDYSLVTDISLYTAVDENMEDETIYENSSFDGSNQFQYTDSVVTLRSAHACVDLSPKNEETNNNNTTLDITQEAMFTTAETNSNRSLTYLPMPMNSISNASTRSKTDNHEQRYIDSVRRSGRYVARLAKRFESKLKESVSKKGAERKNQEIIVSKPVSPPMEILFPPLPVRKLEENDNEVMVSKLEYTPSKRAQKIG